VEREDSRGTVEVAGIAIAAPGQPRRALELAIQRAGLARGRVEEVFTDDPDAYGLDVGGLVGRPTASGSVFALVAAALACRRRSATVAVVTSAVKSSSCALVLRWRNGS
jgi:hypothetical protein